MQHKLLCGFHDGCWLDLDMIYYKPFMSQHVAKVCILYSLTKSLQVFFIYFEKWNLMKMMGGKKEKDPSPLLGE
jgi:hypothetical protein